jgi:hypothetical protein
MKYKVILSALFLLLAYLLPAQPTPERRSIRIVDTLTAQERNSRNPIILRAELDSLLQLHNATIPVVQPKVVPDRATTELPQWVMITGGLALLVIGLLLLRLSSYQKRLNRVVGDLKRLVQNFDFLAATGSNGNGSTKPSRSRQDKKIHELSEELERQKSSHQLLLEEYESVKGAIEETYKLKNYPTYHKEKQDGQLIREWVDTERAVAMHAFEKYLKPVIAITDANKNNPARISKEDSQKILELLVSLSLYHIEYLYLRVNDLAVGGNIARRIGSNGKGIEVGLLKKLDLEHGSRALALRMALNKSGVDKLSYPVFDETDLNNY